MANKTAQEAGLKGLQKETVNRNMLNPTLDAQGMENIIKQDLAKGLKIKNGQFTEGRYIQVLRGINNIRKVSGIKAVEGLNLQQVAQAADEKKVAKILLEKTGRKDPKQQKAIKKKAAKQFKEETTWNDGLLLRNVQILQRLEKSSGSTL